MLTPRKALKHVEKITGEGNENGRSQLDRHGYRRAQARVGWRDVVCGLCSTSEWSRQRKKKEVGHKTLTSRRHPADKCLLYLVTILRGRLCNILPMSALCIPPGYKQDVRRWHPGDIPWTNVCYITLRYCGVVCANILRMSALCIPPGYKQDVGRWHPGDIPWTNECYITLRYCGVVCANILRMSALCIPPGYKQDVGR